MFQQIKNLREESASTASELTQLKVQLQEMQTFYKQEKEELTEIKNLQIDFVNHFKQNLHGLKVLQETIAKEIQQFRALQSTVARVLVEKLEKELAELTSQTKETLRNDSERHKILNQNIEATIKNLATLNTQVQHLHTVVSTIKQSDFSLNQFAEQLHKEDKHKLELMQEVDRLQSMVAKMKRTIPRRVVPRYL